MVLQNLALLVFKADYRTLKTVYSDLYIRVGEVTIGYPKLLAFVSAVLIAAGLAYLLIKTDFGKAMRAAAQDPQVAQLMGINTDRIYMLAVGLASAITGAAGALIMPYFYVFPMVGAHFTTTCFCVVIMGGSGQCQGGLLVRADSRLGRSHGKLFHLQRFGVDDILYFAGIRLDVQTARTLIQGAHLNEGSIGIHNQIRFHRLCQTG